MGTEQPGIQVKPLGQRSWLLLRGESVVASAGIALAAILLAVMAASAWWTVHTQRSALESAQAAQVRAVGELLARSVEALLTQDELTAARRLVTEAAGAYRLAQVRVVLSDGQVVAANEPSQTTLQKLPATWVRTRTLDEQSIPPGGPGAVALTYPLTVGGRGQATLAIAAKIEPPAWAAWETQAGVGAIGAAAMLCLLLVYRRMRARLGAIGAIRDALLSLADAQSQGEAAVSALPPTTLLVSPDLGPEAVAWNDVVAEKEKLRKQAVAEKARESFGRRGQAKGDLSAACDAMSQGLVLVDERNQVSYANGAAAVFLQAKREELIGADVSRFLQVQNVLEVIQQVAAGTLKRRSVLDVERKDEGGAAGVLRFSIRPVRRDDSAAAMVTIEDITQQKVAEAARHAFVAQATHELRTPLTNIRLYVETAIEEGEQDPAARAKCLNVINGETRRLERIVGEMLSVAEIEAGSLKIRRDDVRLETVFEELRADYGAQARDKNVTLAFNLPPKLPAIQGDRDKIMLALHNLVGNALKYTPDGGKVDVTVQVDARQLSVEVRDTGIGMAPDDAERVFERFYRAKDPRVAKITGTGLGLTIAREVVRLHGGDITVDSRLNQGSAFTLSLPVVAEAA